MSITPNNPADFTPQRGSYKELSPFRFWCQKVLPLVYDDSLSYYELLNKVVEFLNMTMEDVTTLEGDVTNLHTAYIELQAYVNDYFVSLDVQEEIDNKLDEMAENGELTSLISPFLPDLISAWLNEYITPTSPIIDKTLSIEDAGADSKTVGVAIIDIYSPTGTYNIGDYCIHEGKIYKCVSQITTAENWTASHWTNINIMNEIKNKSYKVCCTLNNILTFLDNHGINLFNVNNSESGTLNANGYVDESETRVTTEYIPCKYGDTIYYTIISSSGTFQSISAVVITILCFYDKEYNFISGTRVTSTNRVEVPENAFYFRATVPLNHTINNALPSFTINAYPTNQSEVKTFNYLFVELATKQDIQNLSALISYINTDVQNIYSFLPTEESDNKCNKDTFVDGNINNDGTINSSATNRKTSDFIECKANDIIYFTYVNAVGTFYSHTSMVMQTIAFYDSEKVYIDNSRQTSTNAVTAPSNSKYFRVCLIATQIAEDVLPSLTINYYPTNAREVEKYYYKIEAIPTKKDITGGYDNFIIDCWGDSRTEMIANNGTSYCNYLNTLLGADFIVCNYGESSESSGMCSARLGSNEVFVTLEENQINASGNTALTDIVCSTGNNRNLYAFSETKGIICCINGVWGLLHRSSISNYTKCYFTRFDTGNAVPVKAHTKIVVPDMNSRKHFSILWWGKNDFGSAGNFVVSGIIDNYKNAVEYLMNQNFLILGETCNLQNSYLPNGRDRLKLDEINNTLSMLYPDNFIDINAYLASTEALTSVGLTPTQADLDNIANGFPCEQLMVHSTDSSDVTHPNEYGRQAIANKIYSWLVEKELV